jgi:hypothetical protein
MCPSATLDGVEWPLSCNGCFTAGEREPPVSNEQEAG